MERKWIFWAIVMVVALIFWFYIDAQQGIDYHRHTELIDPTTGAKRPPSDLLNLPKVINYTGHYIESTNAHERLYDLVYQMYLENLFTYDHSYSSAQDLRVSGWPVANGTVCGQQLDWILGKLNTRPDYPSLRGQLGYELTRFMDTFGRPESRFYAGAVHWMGSSMACSRASLDSGRIKTRYCIARMRPAWWPRNESSYKRTSIRMGICVPETCDSSSFDDHGDAIARLAKWELPDLYKSGFSLESLFCLPDERSPIRQLPLGGKIYLSLVGCWIALVLGASIVYEVSFKRRRQRPRKTHSQTTTIQLMPSTEGERVKGVSGNDHCQSVKGAEFNFFYHILKALSIREAFKSLGKHKNRVKYHRGQRVRLNMDCLNLVKSLMTILIVFGHSGHSVIWYTRILRNRIDLTVNPISVMALSITLCVDSFFLIFGLLSTYSLMKKFNTIQLGNPLLWLGINVNTIARIVPSFTLLYWYIRLISPYTGSGPWWDYGVDEFSMKGVCVREPWWKSIPHFGNFGTPPLTPCMPHGWFMTCYAQISLLVPLITYLVSKAPSNFFKFALIAYLALVGGLYQAYNLCTQTTFKSLALGFYGGFMVDLLGNFEFPAYLTSLRRLGGVAVGCLVGYLLRRYELGEIKSWPRWLTHPITVTATSLYLVLIVCGPLLSKDFVSLPAFALFDVFNIIQWSIVNSIIFINMTTTYNQKLLPRLCGHAFWHAFNKLGLVIYLIHWEINIAVNTNSEYASSFGVTTDWLKTWSLSLITSTVVSIIIYIFVQAPIGKIMLLPTKNSGTPSKNQLSEV